MPRNGDKMKLKYYMRGIGVGILFSIMVFLIVGEEDPQMTDEQIIAAAKELGMEEKKTIDLSGLNPTPVASIDDKGDNLKDPNNLSNEEKGDTDKKENNPSITPDSDASEVDSSNSIDDQKNEDDTSVNSDDKKNGDDTSVNSDDKMNKDDAASNPDESKNADELEKDNNTSVDNNSTSDKGEINESDEIKTLVISKGMYSHDVADLCESIGLVKNAKEFDSYLIQNGYASNIRINRYEIQVGASYEEIARLITKRPQY
mgnify:CR=1 FL=1